MESLKGGFKKVDFIGNMSPIRGGGYGFDPLPRKEVDFFQTKDKFKNIQHALKTVFYENNFCHP